HHRPISTLFPYTTLFRSEYADGWDDHRFDTRHRYLSTQRAESPAGQFPVGNTDGAAPACGNRLDRAQRWGGATRPCSRWSAADRSEEHTSELQSRRELVC